jgi:hypothetical protein
MPLALNVTLCSQIMSYIIGLKRDMRREKITTQYFFQLFMSRLKEIELFEILVLSINVLIRPNLY